MFCDTEIPLLGIYLVTHEYRETCARMLIVYRYRESSVNDASVEKWKRTVVHSYSELIYGT